MENKMTNQERLKEYLVGEKGYLKNDISNGKVVMLSGKWGSGKTHFWKNIIEKDLIEFQTKKQKAYIYTSLYGNTSINKIEDNIYAQAYLCSIGGENIVLKGYEKVKDFGKRFGSFCSLLDVSKLIDGVDEIQKNNIKNSALLYLEKGGIVCFDDFERKSKDIDLNDLFGFITQLTQNFNCKVVIILNDDVFEGEEKKIFSNVKEKSVSKFLKYEPKIEELFNLIFDLEIEKDNKKEKKYKDLEPYKQIILQTIEETEELNARIYIQVLDNLVEWIENQEKDDDTLRCLILVNINFILNHKIVITSTKENLNPVDGKRYKSKLFNIKEFEKETLYSELFEIIDKKQYSKESIIENLVQDELEKHSEHYVQSIVENRKNFIKENRINIYAISFASIHNFDENVSKENLNKINNFIETGILINE